MRIGLTYTGSDEKHANYVSWLKDGDNTIDVVMLGAGDTWEGLDALVLSGGVDVHPELYKGPMSYDKAPVEWEMERDVFERRMLEAALGQGAPVLGVCRGLQLMNVCFGGTLVQDLGENGDATHENITGEDKEHEVRVFRGTLLYEVSGKESGIANSAHHQAIDRLGEGLRVNSRAMDGTIEGIEWEEPAGKPFLLAVQWHPERMYTEGMADAFLYKAIRDRFIKTIRSAGHTRKEGVL